MNHLTTNKADCTAIIEGRAINNDTHVSNTNSLENKTLLLLKIKIASTKRLTIDNAR